MTPSSPVPPSADKVGENDRWSFVLAIGIAAGIVLPLLGAVGFFDPWETNYAEVARQMAVRDDYLYPYWKDAYFFSKPVLLFWLEAPSLKLLGADQPGGALSPLTELALRLPSALTSIFTVGCTFFAARRLWSSRAAFLSATVLATMTFWTFMARQAITDMLYVGLASSGLLLLAVALFSEDVDAQTGGERHGGRDEPLPRWLLVLAALLLVPQLWEIGRSGAFLNRVALFGSETAARTVTSLVLCAGALALVAWLAKHARDPLLHLAAILFALSALAKGPVGIALCAAPLLVTIAFLGEWGRLLRPAAASCTVLFLAIAGPWFAVMSAFTGLDDQRKTWFSRFVLYDLLGRVGEGAHGDRGTFDYYLRYAGFGLFPWSAIVPIALIDAALKPFRSRAGRFLLLVALWAVITFVFFSVTTTKFHHYIFPLCVPAALLVGRFLDELMESGAPRIAPVAAVIIVLLTALIGRDLVTEPWQLIDLFTYHYKSYKPEYYFPSDPEWRVGLSIACFGAAAAIGIGLGLDIATPQGDGPARTWLERITLGNRGANSNFVAAALLASVFFAVFVVQVHFNRASQHWSQRSLLATYYEMRRGEEPLIAYQMDWKGETFYGRNNDVQVKKSGADLKKLVERDGREFVLVQADRFGGMKSALGKDYEAKITVVNRSNVKWYLVLVDE